MNNGQKSLSINETFIIEAENDGTMSACTGFFTNALISCSGNTQILLGNNIIQSNSAFSATTFYGDGSNLTGITTKDTFVTGGTYSNGTAIFTNNTGGTFSISGFNITTPILFTGGTVSGATNFTYGLTANTIFANTYQNLPIDVRLTGGTYSNGTTIFTNNTGGTFSISGFSTGYTLTSSAITTTLGYVPYDSSNPNNYISGVTNNDIINALGYLPISSDTFVTGGTYSNNTLTYTNNTGGTFNVLFNTVSGLTVNGDLNITGNTNTTTLSATTYLGLPPDIRVTGGTFSVQNNNINLINNNGETITISGVSSTSELSLRTGKQTLYSDFLSNNAAFNPPFLGAAISGGGASAPQSNLSSPNNFGVIDMNGSLSSVINSGYRFKLAVANANLNNSEPLQTDAIVAVTTLGASSGLIRFGLLDTLTSTDATNGVYFEISAGTVSAKSARNSVRTNTTMFTITPNEFFHFRVVYNNSSNAVFSVFSMNGNLVSSVTITTNVPLSQNTDCGIIATVITASPIIICRLDYMSITRSAYSSRGALT